MGVVIGRRQETAPDLAKKGPVAGTDDERDGRDSGGGDGEELGGGEVDGAGQVPERLAELEVSDGPGVRGHPGHNGGDDGGGEEGNLDGRGIVLGDLLPGGDGLEGIRRRTGSGEKSHGCFFSFLFLLKHPVLKLTGEIKM